MSRNYELLKQAGLERERSEPVAPGLEYVPAFGFRKVTDNGDVLNLDRLAQEEALKLVQRVFLAESAERARMVVFAGIDHGNGCSRICVQASEILARNVNGSACVVDGNLRSPSLPGYFGVGNHRGLTNALLEGGPIRSFAQCLRPNDLWLLSCGSSAAEFPLLLDSERLRARLSELRGEFNHILIDAPPLNHYDDAITLGQLADGLVLILEANSTRREVARKVAESLRAAKVPILGAVLNKRTFPIPEPLYRKL